ncbi:MAG: NAD(P)/FAD-dependent oxidoreductase [Anaerolineales bacterium]|nr:MAG: NAD(P)/FAD-dependent oxidoreductase [Anaerolineales bacterium]
MKGKTILVLGGGVGGVVTANALREHLASEHRIVVVDKRAEYIFTPSLPWLMVGWRQLGQLTKDLRRLLRPGIEVVQAEVKAIDPDRSRVRAGGEELAYDYLVLALGADLAPEVMPGYLEVAHNFFDLEGAAGLWPALQRFEGGRVAVLVSAMPYKCPAAPYEAAMLIEDALRRRGIRDRCQVQVFTPEPQPMLVAGLDMGVAVVGMMAAKNIGFHPNLPLDHIDAARQTLVFKNGRQEPFDFVAAVPPHRPPPVVKESPLANESGWIPVDKHTLQTRFENVYAIGDVTAIILSNGLPLPKAGTFAHAEGEAVAARIAAEIGGRTPQAEFNGVGYCWIEAGGGSAGFTSGQFYAEPNPVVGQPRSGRLWHWGKVMFEIYWMGEGFRRSAARSVLNLGSKYFGIPASL